MSVTVYSNSDLPELEDLRYVADDVWASLLGEGEELTPRFVPPGTPFDDGGTWSGAVSVSGGWQGTITAELGAPAAVELAMRMLDLPPEEGVTDADIADAIGELVNVVGGNVKSLMPGPSQLSLPMSAAGRAAHPSDLQEILRVDAIWHDQPVRFCVHVPRDH